MIVYKFGGTSLADAERIRRAAGLVLGAPGTPVVVVSALGGVTNRLLEIADRRERGEGAACRALVEEIGERHRKTARALLDPAEGAPVEAGAAEESAGLERELDEVLDRLTEAARCPPPHDEGPPTGPAGRDALTACGEDLSAHLLTAALRAQGAEAELVDARTVIRTDERSGRANPLPERIRERAEAHLRPLVERGVVPVVPGFVGESESGRTTTLGRGGSDLTAAILGAALQADEVVIWTDVEGILSGDPRSIDAARVLPEIGFDEAVELSHFGARVIHAPAARHAVSRGVSLRIRNAFAPDKEGTLIRADRRGGAEVAAVAYKPDVVLIKVRSHPSALEYGFLARVFDVLARHQLPVDLVATSHSSTAFTIDEDEELDPALAELEVFAEVEVIADLATVTVVGHGLLQEPGMSALVFWAVGKDTSVELISQASDVSLSFLVPEAGAPGVVRRLHRTLIEIRGERVLALRKAEPRGEESP